MKLPTGTVSFESISEGRLLGKVDCEPKVIGGGLMLDQGGGRGGKVRHEKVKIIILILGGQPSCLRGN